MDPYRKPEEHTSERVKEWLRNTSVVAPWETEAKMTAKGPTSTVTGRLLYVSSPILGWCSGIIAVGWADDRFHFGSSLHGSIVITSCLLFALACAWSGEMSSRK